MEDVRVLAFFYLEQAALMSFVGMGLIGIRLSWQQIVAVGAFQGIVVYLSRGIFYGLLDLLYGLHSFISFCSFLIILHLVAKRDWGISLAATFIAFIVTMLSESTAVPFYNNFFPLVSIEELSTDIWLHIKAGYFSDWFLLLMAVFLGLFKKPLINIEAKKQKV